jgi:hypothetical protein
MQIDTQRDREIKYSGNSLLFAIRHAYQIELEIKSTTTIEGKEKKHEIFATYTLSRIFSLNVQHIQGVYNSVKYLKKTFGQVHLFSAFPFSSNRKGIG